MTIPITTLANDTLHLRVLTLNVWSGLNYTGIWKMGEYETPAHRNQRYDLLVEKLKESQPDVICLQEVNPAPEYARKLAHDIGYKAYAFVGMGGIHLGPIGIPINFREGDAILIKPEFDVQSLGRRKLSGQGISTNWITFHFGEINQGIGIRISKDNWQIDVFNTHLHAGPALNSSTVNLLQKQWKSGNITDQEYAEIAGKFAHHAERRYQEALGLLRFILKKARKNDIIIVAGDFNCVQGSAAYQLMSDAGFSDTGVQGGAKDKFTWDPGQNSNIQRYYNAPTKSLTVLNLLNWKYDHLPRRIDYIWVGKTQTGAWKNTDTRLFGVAPEDGVQISDHFGYLTELKFER